MDDFKKKMRRRQLLLVAALLLACCLILLSRHYDKISSESEFLYGFVSGFQVGIIIAIFGFLVYFLIRNALAMKSPERLKKLYISETD